MIQLSDSHLIVAIQGINDALRYNRRFSESETQVNAADQDEYIYTLSELASYLREEYSKRLLSNTRLPNYSKLVPESRDSESEI